MLDADAAGKDFYFDAVSQIRMPSWSTRPRGLGRRCGGVSVVAGRPGLGAGHDRGVRAGGGAGPSRRRSPQAFARYQERLAPLLRSKQDAAQGLGLAFAPRNRLQLLVRNTVMRLMGLPKVADLAMGRSFHDAVELPAFPAA